MNVPLSSDDRGGAVQPLLIVRDLKKHFAAKGSFWSLSRDKVQAVDGVSFSVAKGQTVAANGQFGADGVISQTKELVFTRWAAGTTSDMAALRQVLLDTITDEDIRALAAELVAQARAGDLTATKLLFTYVIGKPTEYVDPGSIRPTRRWSRCARRRDSSTREW